MKESKEKEHRISNLKDMINNVKDDKKVESSEIEEEEIEEDSELIEYLNEDNLDYEKLEIDDEYIYHPGDEDSHTINLEENPIDEDFIIKTPKTKDVEDIDEISDFEDFSDDFGGEISDSFDQVIHARIHGRPILAIIGSILGVIFLIISIVIFQSRSDRIIDNVVAGETNFMFVIFFILGLFLLLYSVFKFFDLNNPFEQITKSIDSIETIKVDKEEKETVQTPKEPSPKVIPKSKIPLDKEAYKIGEFDMDDLKFSLKNTDSEKENSENKNDDETEELTEEEIEKEYEKAKLETESIDDIFAEVEDIDEIPIISVDSKEEEK